MSHHEKEMNITAVEKEPKRQHKIRHRIYLSAVQYFADPPKLIVHWVIF